MSSNYRRARLFVRPGVVHAQRGQGMPLSEEACAFIGQLALALYPHKIAIRPSTLHKILQDRGLGVRERDMAGMLEDACDYWGGKDQVVYHAVVASFIA